MQSNVDAHEVPVTQLHRYEARPIYPAPRIYTSTGNFRSVVKHKLSPLSWNAWSGEADAESRGLS